MTAGNPRPDRAPEPSTRTIRAAHRLAQALVQALADSQADGSAAGRPDAGGETRDPPEAAVGRGGTPEIGDHPGGAENTRGILRDFPAAERGNRSGQSEVGEGEAVSRSVAVFQRQFSVTEAFATWEGRLVLDKIFGDGFGTYPLGTFSEGKQIPPATALRARVAAAIDERKAMREIRKWHARTARFPALGFPDGGLMGVPTMLQVDGRRVTPRQFIDAIQRQEDVARWGSVQGRCCG